jgi:predicted regulator of Ras-like GTPase activity (Roadblock/LC7/MglB family)
LIPFVDDTDSKPADQAIDRYAVALRRLVSAAPGVRAVVLADRQGKVRASVLRDPLPVQTLAATANTLLSAARDLLSQAQRGECEHLTIESADGVIVAMSVGDARGRLLLCVATDTSAMLGQVLWASRRCCLQLRSAADAGAS